MFVSLEPVEPVQTKWVVLLGLHGGCPPMFYFVVNLKKFETLNSLLCSSISSQCKEVTSAFLHISAMHASGILLPDLRMTNIGAANFLQGTPCFTAVEQLSELVATRRANMSTAMLRMASVSRAVGTKFCQ